jgi:two-component system, sensor histidine kinase
LFCSVLACFPAILLGNFLSFWGTYDMERIETALEPALAAAIQDPGPMAELADHSNSRPMVLLMEDDDDARAIYRDMLIFAGFNVVAAADGLEGLRYAEARPPDIVVTDLHMPGMNGVEVARTLRADRRCPPIIAVTADSLGPNPGGQWADARQLFAEVLVKPVSPGQLVRTVQGYMSPPAAQE